MHQLEEEYRMAVYVHNNIIPCNIISYQTRVLQKKCSSYLLGYDTQVCINHSCGFNEMSRKVETKLLITFYNTTPCFSGVVI